MSSTFAELSENFFWSCLILKIVVRWLLIFAPRVGSGHKLHSLHNNNNEMDFYFHLQHRSSVGFTEPQNVWFPRTLDFNILERRTSRIEEQIFQLIAIKRNVYKNEKVSTRESPILERVNFLAWS